MNIVEQTQLSAALAELEKQAGVKSKLMSRVGARIKSDASKQGGPILGNGVKSPPVRSTPMSGSAPTPAVPVTTASTPVVPRSQRGNYPIVTDEVKYRAPSGTNAPSNAPTGTPVVPRSQRGQMQRPQQQQAATTATTPVQAQSAAPSRVQNPNQAETVAKMKSQSQSRAPAKAAPAEATPTPQTATEAVAQVRASSTAASQAKAQGIIQAQTEAKAAKAAIPTVQAPVAANPVAAASDTQVAQKGTARRLIRNKGEAPVQAPVQAPAEAQLAQTGTATKRWTRNRVAAPATAESGGGWWDKALAGGLGVAGAAGLKAAHAAGAAGAKGATTTGMGALGVGAVGVGSLGVGAALGSSSNQPKSTTAYY